MASSKHRCRLLTAVCLLLLLTIPAPAWSEPVAASETPSFSDDLELYQLDHAIDRSLAFLQARPPATRYPVAGQVVEARHLIASLRHLQRLLATHPDPETLDREIKRAYDIIPVNRTPDTAAKRMLITGYFQPVFPGRLDRQPPFVHPLYRVPADLLVRQINGKKQVLGRRDHGRVEPYWTRRQIEQGSLLKGQELVWLKDPFDAFVLHIQGSGIIELPDGSRRGVHYAINNGRPYRSVGKYMVDTGRMSLAEVTMDSLRRYIETHPDERDLILHQNEAFIFFEWSRPGPAIGSLGQELTPGRSIAADQQWYPPGSLVFLTSRRPVMADGEVQEWRAMRRLVTVQDTGSALTGPGRLDVFWGTGDQAGQEAGQMKEDGTACLLLLKEGADRRSERE